MDISPSFTPTRWLARSPALQTLVDRGFVHQCTAPSRLDELLRGSSVPVYAGFDATADSLHVGHLLPIMALRRLQQCGHKPIILMGGGTTRIGDPSFRSDARPMLSDDQIASNIAGIRSVFDRFLSFGEGPSDAVMVNNAQWLDELGYIDVLRDVGRHFSVNRMLAFDSVRSRLERQESLSFLEFNYMILQAYDFLELFRRFGCKVQLGGSDQWGNIVNGVDLVRRVRGEEAFGLTAPLLSTSSGAKMGKTATGAVWLNTARLPSFDYWQFWRNTEDGDVGRFLRLFTDLPLDEIAKLEVLKGSELNEAKRVLATKATALAHGEEASSQAEDAARAAFAPGAASNGLPTVSLADALLRDGMNVAALLMHSGLSNSKTQARRLIEGRGVKLDGITLVNVDAMITADDFKDAAAKRLSIGKKRHVLIRRES